MANPMEAPRADRDKPQRERLAPGNERLIDRSARWPKSSGPGPIRRLVIHESRRLIVVRLEEVDWIEGAGNYVRIHVGGRSRLHRQTLAGLHDSLDPDCFARVHRSAIVRLDAIALIERDTSGGVAIELRNGERVAVSRRYRRELSLHLEMP